MNMFVVLRAPGKSWEVGKSALEQPYVDEHAEFMNRLFEAGKIMLGGPFTDGSGAMVIVRTTTEQQAHTIFDDDPWVLQTILDRGQVKPWEVFINGFTPGQ